MTKVDDSQLYILPPIVRKNSGSGSTIKQQTIQDSNATESLLAICRNFYRPLPNNNNTSVNREYLKSVSTGLEFSKDVVEERSAHMLPYDKSKLKWLLRTDDVIPKPARTKYVVGRHNTRVPSTIHPPCHLKQIIPPLPKPLKVNQVTKPVIYKEEEYTAPRSQGQNGQSLTADMATITYSKKAITFLAKQNNVNGSTEPSAFLTESHDVRPKKGRKPSTLLALAKYQYESCLLSLIGPRMANWIVQNLLSGEQKESLNCLITDWHGKIDTSDMVIKHEDQVDVGELTPYDSYSSVNAKKSWKGPQVSLLEKVYGSKPAPPRATDPYSENNEAPFYRQPTSIRKRTKIERKELAGEINSTAKNIHVVTYEPAPPPNLKDFMNPLAGSTCHVTSCAFENELFTDVKQVHQNDTSKIVMETNNRYRKQLQTSFPPDPAEWYKECAPKDEHTAIVKGADRWIGMPEAIDDTKTLDRYPHEVGAKVTESKIERINNPSVVKIVDDWRSRMHLKTQFLDCTYDDLIHDMADIQSHVRLKAIATIAKASTYKTESDHGFRSNGKKDKPIVSDKIFVSLDFLLDDVCLEVRTAAAVALCSLGRPSVKSKKILRDSMRLGNAVDKWASVECLARYGDSDSEVIAEIIRVLMNKEDAVLHEQAASLLIRISYVSTLVHPLVAEQLNNKGWRQKIIACKVLPTLNGPINKDVTNKLVSMMWKDWHSEVRTCAAQALGKTGSGRVVHDDLINKIETGNEGVRVEAISKIGHLGIMTAKLLPAFLQCFTDPYFSVRLEACITCGNLRIQDVSILKELVKLASHDNMWKVKAMAMQAIAKIGLELPEIKSMLVWALRYESQPGVRVEACRSLSRLNLVTEKVAAILQDQLLVETNDKVRKEISRSLNEVGLETSQDLNIAAEIKKEVMKLGQTDLISKQILINEGLDKMEKDIDERVYQQQPDQKISKPSIEETIASTDGETSGDVNVLSYDANSADDDKFTDILHSVAPSLADGVLRYKNLCRTGLNLSGQPQKENVKQMSIKVGSEFAGSSTLSDKLDTSFESDRESVRSKRLVTPVHSEITTTLDKVTVVRKMSMNPNIEGVIVSDDGGSVSDGGSASEGSASSRSTSSRGSGSDKSGSEVSGGSKAGRPNDEDVRESEGESAEKMGDVSNDMTSEEMRQELIPSETAFSGHDRLLQHSDDSITSTTPTSTSAKRNVILNADDMKEKTKLEQVSGGIFVNLERRYSEKVITVESQVGFLKIMPSDVVILESEVREDGGETLDDGTLGKEIKESRKRKISGKTATFDDQKFASDAQMPVSCPESPYSRGEMTSEECQQSETRDMISEYNIM